MRDRGWYGLHSYYSLETTNDEMKIAFKTLLIVHTLISDDMDGRVMGYLSTHPSILNVTGFRDTTAGGQGMDQSKNIKAYGSYLEERVLAFRDLRIDVFRRGNETANDWLALRAQVPLILKVLTRILEAKYFLDSIDNDITVESVRFLVQDLMTLVRVVNQAVAKIMKLFFTLPHSDAVVALDIYRRFAELSTLTDDYLSMVKRIQYGLQIQIPELSFPPLSLIKTLNDYLNSPDFEQQRQSKLASQTNSQGPLRQEAQHATRSNQMINVFKMNDDRNAASSASDIDFFGALAPSPAVPQQQQQQPSRQFISSAPAANTAPRQNFQQQQQQQFSTQNSQMSMFQNQSPYMNQQGAYSSPILPSHTQNVHAQNSFYMQANTSSGSLPPISNSNFGNPMFSGAVPQQAQYQPQNAFFSAPVSPSTPFGQSQNMMQNQTVPRQQYQQQQLQQQQQPQQRQQQFGNSFSLI
eukprot:Partr_v1_DN27437_c1_g1_i8_m71510 putative ENTH domain-containing protein